MGENHAKFGLFKNCESFPSIVSCCGCEVIVLDEHVNLIDICPNDPPSFDCALFEGQGFDSVKVEPLPLSIVKGEPYAFDEDYLNDLCRFVNMILFMSPLIGMEKKFDVDVEFDFSEGKPFEGASLSLFYTWTKLFGKSLC